jgi:hypothetical protein
MNGNLKDVCHYLKNIIISHTPDDLRVADSFRFGLTDVEIKKGIDAFRLFLYTMYDKIAADGFPVINELSAILYSMGVQGRLETEPVPTLTVCGSDLLVKTKKHSTPHQTMKKMSNKRAAELFAFLSEMGFWFEGIDDSKPVKLLETGIFHVSNESDSDIIIGLKLLATAQAHILTDWERLQSHFMRCEFHPLENETSQWYDVKFSDCINTQPPDIKKWLIDLHKLLMDNGCSVEGCMWDYVYFTYTLPKSKKPVCRIDMVLSGCKITPNTIRTKYLDEIAPKLPDDFVDALKEDGCKGGCIGGKNCKKGPYTVSHNGVEYLSCNNPPHKIAGFNIPVKTAENRGIIRKWIESELIVRHSLQ